MNVPNGKLGDIRDTLEKNGVPFRTMIPHHGTTHVLVIDTEGNTAHGINQAAKDLGTKAAHYKGSASFIGGDTREEGAQAFKRILSH